MSMLLPEVAAGAALLADELGDQVIDERILLAPALDGDRSPVRVALEQVGFPVEEMMPKPGPRHSWPPGPASVGRIWPPAVFTLMARAEGLAAGLGTVAADEQVVLAALWDPRGALSTQLWGHGISRERVVEALAALGVSVPESPLPAQGDADWKPPSTSLRGG